MRFLLKFYKDGYISYTSHLDMLRLFKRSFKRVGIKLQYSQGFNPHPKMSFAQPLSLGYLSTSEYLEFETVDDSNAEVIKEKLNDIMPEGLGILGCCQIPTGGKTMAALVEYGDYEILIPYKSELKEDPNLLVTEFMNQDNIIINKLQKKTGKEVEVDIKPLIFQACCSPVDNNLIMLTIRISTGSTANLSPENLLTAFTKFADIEFDRAEVKIKRTELYCKKDNKIIPLGNYFTV